MTRVLQALQERLRREEKAASKAEDKLARHDTLRNSGSLSFTSLPYHEKSKAMAAARLNGLHPRGAAGAPPRAVSALPKARRPGKEDWGRPRSTGPPMATRVDCR